MNKIAEFIAYFREHVESGSVGRTVGVNPSGVSSFLQTVKSNVNNIKMMIIVAMVEVEVAQSEGEVLEGDSHFSRFALLAQALIAYRVLVIAKKVGPCMVASHFFRSDDS